MILALGLALAGSCGDGGALPADGPLPQRVLLISLDTLRADHTGFGGHDQDTTPFLDSLAERGVVFDNHFANSNCTLPSHATMLTGLHYPSHGVFPPKNDTDPIKVLPQSAVTLAERFQEEGYSTAAFTSHGAWLNEAHGFNQGFDHFVSRWTDADTIIEDYLELVDESPQENSFTFLHVFDIHSDNAQKGPCLPYQSTPKLVKQFAGEKPEGFTGCSSTPGREHQCSSKYLKDLSMKIEPLPEDHLEYIIGLYDAGIRHLDEKLRGLFEELEKRGQLENTLVIITSDHGESFFEHESMLHDTHHDEVARVPLIILLPSTSGVAPRRIEALTQSTDLAPTILDLCGLEPIGQLPSLAPAIMLNEEPDDGLILFHGHILVGRDEVGEYKFVKTGRNKPPIFYDRGEDPGEQHNLLSDTQYQTDQRARLLAIYTQLNELFADCKDINEMLASLDSGDGATLSEERIAELKNLGYLGGGADEPARNSDGDSSEQQEPGDL
jgi:hypothetical protein